MTFQPSPQQSKFFDFLRDNSRSAVLSAVAGSGKTTTIVEGCKHVPKGQTIRFLAFNKSIAETLKERLPLTVDASTFHSAWYAAARQNLPQSPKVDTKKLLNIFKQNLNRKDFELYYKFSSRLVGYAKSVGLGTSIGGDIMDMGEWFNLISHFGLFLGDEDADESVGIRIARDALRQSISDTKIIDFDDMLYLPLVKGYGCPKTNFVFVDEAQDLNGVQRELLKRMLPPQSGPATSRLIAVGDPHQAIYGFRGADNDSLDTLEKEWNAVRFPLSVSYRCSQAVVKEAQRVLEK